MFAWRRVGFALLLSLALLAMTVPSARATEADGLRLPMNSLGCVNCHVSDARALESKAPADLNPFGQDFLDAGRTWTESLAKLDSDGDGCLNGFELGDPQGTWDPDRDLPSTNDQEYNPGVADCNAASLSERSWGILKAVFGEADQFKIR